MSRNGQERLFEGWLTKSPPIKRIWRGRWRKRWFALQQSGDLPGQYVLIYYADRNCRKVKGVIDLDHCEQVDTGLKFEDKKIKYDYMFDIKTPSRTYYLAAETEQEMKTWVKYICNVCGLKATSDEEDVNIIQEMVSAVDVQATKSEVPVKETVSTNNIVQSPPISPVSTSPYIPISECISGPSPLITSQGIKDFQTLLQYNLKNSFFRSHNYNNDTYDTTAPPTYLNFVNPIHDPRSYDIPRLLQPPPPKNQNTSKLFEDNSYQNVDKINSSPLQSPTDSESVFTDDDWSHNTTATSDKSSNNPRPSDSSAELDLSQKFGKLSVDSLKLHDASNSVPPRPPKPAHIAPNYFNFPLSSTLTKKDKPEKFDNKISVPLDDAHVLAPITDEMYDFPRSLNSETEMMKNTLIKRHCYNNAAPGSVDGQIFRYDISPKPGTSGTQLFKYDMEEILDEPASPMSHSSSTHAYSNLPSPLLPDTQLMPPPVVNRGLKPKRKLSDSLSISSNPEPPSPCLAPSVDRKLKPPAIASAVVKQKSLEGDEDSICRKLKSLPSPTPSGLHRSHDSLLYENEQIYHCLSDEGMSNNQQNYHKLEYLDLDLDIASQFTKPTVQQPPRSPGANTVYKEVDFMKTMAFNITRNNLEKERNETVPLLKK